MFDAADYLGQLSVRAQKQAAEANMNVNVENDADPWRPDHG